MARYLLLLPLLACLLTGRAEAQVLVGECQESQTGRIFGIFSNYFVKEKFSPAPGAFGYRDPSGQTLMRMPSADPYNAYWLAWNGSIVRINQFSGQLYSAGTCVLDQGFLQASHVQIFGMPQQYASLQFDVNHGMGNPTLTRSIPRELLDPEIEVIRARRPDLVIAQSCEQHLASKNAFLDCMAPQFLGEREQAYYRCMRNGGTTTDMGTCMLIETLGSNERNALDTARTCYAQHGSDWNKYPLCAIANSIQFDEKTTRALQCLQESAKSGQGFDYLGLGVCYAGPELTAGMNQESLVAMQCAMSSGGDPMTFAGCTGGQLTAIELNKCFTHGIGGNGCFGDGNTLVATVNNITDEMSRQFGPNSVPVVAWNAVAMGTGAVTAEAEKVVSNSVRELEKAGRNIEKEVRKVVPRIKIKLF